MYNGMCVVWVFFASSPEEKSQPQVWRKRDGPSGVHHTVLVPLVACAEELRASLSACLPAVRVPQDAVSYTALNPVPWLHP